MARPKDIERGESKIVDGLIGRQMTMTYQTLYSSIRRCGCHCNACVAFCLRDNTRTCACQCRVATTSDQHLERAFAKTMADRDHAAFAMFVSDEGLFSSLAVRQLHGKKKLLIGGRIFIPSPRHHSRGNHKLWKYCRQARWRWSTGPVHNALGKIDW